jgi:hypothetical protein
MSRLTGLTRRIERLEQQTQARARVESRLDPRCICYPEGCAPWVGFPILDTIAFLVKCPLHGDRFSWKDVKTRIYVSKWLREKMYRLVFDRSPSFYVFSNLPFQVSEQYHKAYLASFPPDLWPVEEETKEGEGGPTIYLRLKNGTIFPAYQNHFSKPLRERGPDEPRPDRALVRRSNEEKDWIWQAETMRIVGRLLSERGLVVDPIVFS